MINFLPFMGGMGSTVSPEQQQQGGLPNTGIGGWNTFSNVLGGISGLANAYTGFRGLSLARKQLGFQRDAFALNSANQANLVNSQLADRQRHRMATSTDAMPVDQYMMKYGASGSVDEMRQRQNQQQNQTQPQAQPAQSSDNAWNRSRAMNRVGGN